MCANLVERPHPSRWPILVALLLVGPLSACDRPSPLAPGIGQETTSLRRPGIVLVDPEARRTALREADRSAAMALCSADEPPSVPTPPRGPLGPTPGYATDTRLNPMAWFVMRTAAAALVDGEPGARARSALITVLDGWAKAGVLVAPGRDDAATRFAVNRFLLPTIVGWALVRDHPEVEPEVRARIDAWLARLVEAARARLGDRRLHEPSARNNHAYLAASAVMAWGALVGDAAAFAVGPSVFRRALADMRADGSLPLETARGARALWYQRQAVASLVTIAELAALQGHDLYALEIDGRSLHAAIRFLLDAIDEPARVARYAAANRNPGPSPDWRRQDLSFLERRGHGRHYMAWVEFYRARFPDRPETARLEALLWRAGDPRPLVDEFSGGNASCLVGPLGSARARTAWAAPTRAPRPAPGTAG